MPDLTTLDPEYHVVYKCGGQLEYHPYEDDIRTAVTYVSRFKVRWRAVNNYSKTLI